MKLNHSKIKEMLRTKYISEVALELGIKAPNLNYYCRKHGLVSSKKKGQFNVKYSPQFRKQATSLFLKNNARDCAKILGITHGQMIGLIETSRRSGLIQSDFKDTRNRKKWTFDERVSLIQMAGLISRGEIGKRLQRGEQRNIKERIKADFNAGTKFLHGMPITWVKEIIPLYLLDRFIQTKAGPCGRGGRAHFKIIPWSDLEQVQYAVRLPKNVSSAIRSMAKFQRFIFQEDRDWKIRQEIEGIINGK